MSKTAICKELNQKKKALQERIDSLNRKKTSIHWTCCNMEGKYGTKVYDPYADPHFRPYYFTYPSEEVRQKEEEEIEQYRRDAGFYQIDEEIKAINLQIKELDEQICYTKYGMSQEERWKRQRIEKVKKEIAECTARIKTLEQEQEKAEQDLQEYLANKK